MKQSNKSVQSSVSANEDGDDSVEMLHHDPLHQKCLIHSVHCMFISSSYGYHDNVNPAALREVRSMLIKVFCLALLGYAVLPSIVQVKDNPLLAIEIVFDPVNK